MKPVMLGIAGASAKNIGGVLEKSSKAVIEPFAEVLHAVTNTFSPQGTGTSVVESSGEALLENRIHELLSAAGVETTKPLELTISNGKVVVVGDHPQRALIEAALNQDPTLSKDLSELIQGKSASGQAFSASDPSPISGKVLFLNFAGKPRLELL